MSKQQRVSLDNGYAGGVSLKEWTLCGGWAPGVMRRGLKTNEPVDEI